ncbi:MAG: hypothetical protein R2851_06265 [Caldilineaceae bacterium]
MTRIGAQPLGRVAKQELVREYCRKRRGSTARQAGHRRARTVYHQSFVAWTARADTPRCLPRARQRSWRINRGAVRHARRAPHHLTPHNPNTSRPQHH